MKIINKICSGLFAGCIVLLTGCSKNVTVEEAVEVIQKPGRVPFEITAGTLATKTSADASLQTKWVKGDLISLYHAKAGTNNYIFDGDFTAQTSGNNVVFTGSLASALTEDEYDWYAFYPSQSNARPSPYFFMIGNSIYSSGSNSSPYDCFSGFPLFGRANSVGSDNRPEIIMKQLSSLLCVQVTNRTSEKITIAQINFYGPEELGGAYYVDVLSDKTTYEFSENWWDGESARLVLYSGVGVIEVGETRSFYLNMKPFEAPVNSKLKLCVQAENIGIQESTVTVTGAPLSFEAGKVNTVTMNFTKGQSSSPAIEFKDQNMKTVCVNLFDTNLDGELSYEEAEAVKELPENFVGHFYGQHVTSFEELQYFTSLEKIGANAFTYCDQLKKIVLPNSVVEIGRQSFQNLPVLESLNIPESLQTIGDYAFSGCSGVKGELIIPKGVTVINDGAFRGTAITSVTLHDSIERIGHYSFGYCENLSIVAFGQGLKSIGESAFYGCDALRDICLPESLETLDGCPFRACYGIRSFSGKGASQDGKCLVLNRELVACAFDGDKTAQFVLPEEVKSLGMYVFAGLEYEEVILPDHVTSIGWAAFYDCVNMTSITLPANLETIDGPAFYGCSALTEIVLPSYLSTIANNAFGNCTNLTTVYSKNFFPPSVNESHFRGTNLESVYVPEVSVDAYKKDWAYYKDLIKAHHFPELDNPDEYLSTDYSRDGEVHVLQTASEGNGIDIVLMGDCFSDRMIADGTYQDKLEEAVDELFEIEPYASFRHLFNIYIVDVVSPVERYFSATRKAGRLKTYFDEGTRVGGEDSIVQEYALNAISDNRMDDALLIVVMNREYYAGTCYMYNLNDGDFGRGLSISYFPLGLYEGMLGQLIRHEAGGHGFAKLADEYFYTAKISDDMIAKYRKLQTYGGYPNVDFTSDPSQVRWRHFLSDTRYASEGLGVFEGGATYRYGVYRPTKTSIMDNNKGVYNAPSREAIWIRLHKLAYGRNWTYDYEEFVNYDLRKNVNHSSRARKVASGKYEENLPALHPPVIMNRRRP